MSGKGLYVPGKDGKLEFRGVAEEEERPILSYEEDTGRILLNFNLLLLSKFRKLQDITVITGSGVVQGVMITSVPMGPEEKRQCEEYFKRAEKASDGVEKL